MILQLLLKHYYTQIMLVIEVLLSYSNNSLYNIISTVSVFD